MSFTSAPAQPPSRWRDVRIAAVARGASIGGDMLTATALLLALQGRGAGGVAVAACALPVLRAARRERARAAIVRTDSAAAAEPASRPAAAATA